MTTGEEPTIPDHGKIGHLVSHVGANHRVNDRAGIDENERITIRSRICDRGCSVRPRRSRPVLWNDRIPTEYLAQLLSDHASREIGNSARRKSEDQMNGLRGELLCPRLEIAGQCAKDDGGACGNRGAITSHP